MKKILTITLLLFFSLWITSCEKEDYKIKKEVWLKCIQALNDDNIQKELFEEAKKLNYTEYWVMNMEFFEYLGYCFRKEGLDFWLGTSRADPDDSYIIDELLHWHYKELEYQRIFRIKFKDKLNKFLNEK